MDKLFEITPTTVGAFLDLDPIFPRFQRRSTWTNEQRFRLALSLFKGYPLGTVVVKHETRADAEGTDRDVTLVLDGRQRYETLAALITNPEWLWLWGKPVLRVDGKSISSKTSPADLIDAFREYVDNYFFGKEDWEPPDSGEVVAADGGESVQELASQAEEPSTGGSDDAADEQGSADDDADLETSDGEADSQVSTVDPDERILDPSIYGELDELLKLLLFLHGDSVGVTKTKSGLRTPFDLRGGVSGLPYFVQSGASTRIAPDALVLWVKQSDERAHTKMRPTKEQFREWLNTGPSITDEVKLDALLSAKWEGIRRALVLLDRLLGKVRNDTRLGFIELTNQASAQDDKKIFEIINTGGTKLTLAEILSATEIWRARVDVDPTVKQAVRELYAQLGVDYEGDVTKWDLAATVLDRVKAPVAWGRPEDWDWALISAKKEDTRFPRKITFGFRTLSGWYHGNLMKAAVARLAADADIAWWPLELETLANEAQQRIAQLWLFKQLANWRFSFASDASDALAINWVLLTARDWHYRNRPSGGQDAGPRDAFDRDCLALFDRSVFEYARRQWSGSGDSKIAGNLVTLGNDRTISEYDNDSWTQLLKELRSGAIDGDTYTAKQDGRMRIVLTYAAAIIGISPPEPERGDVDHLIPQGDFQGASATEKSSMHHVANLEMLPHSINGTRAGVALHDMGTLQLREDLQKYSRIRVGDFARYGVRANLQTLIQDRMDMLERVFCEYRPAMINDPNNYTPPRETLWVEGE